MTSLNKLKKEKKLSSVYVLSAVISVHCAFNQQLVLYYTCIESKEEGYLSISNTGVEKKTVKRWRWLGVGACLAAAAYRWCACLGTKLHGAFPRKARPHHQPRYLSPLFYPYQRSLVLPYIRIPVTSSSPHFCFDSRTVRFTSNLYILYYHRTRFKVEVCIHLTIIFIH